MTLKDLLKKKDKIKEDDTQHSAAAPSASPEFTFMRTTTTTQEIITPPTYAGDSLSTINESQTTNPKRSRFHRNSNASITSNPYSGHSEKGEKRLSQRLHLRSRTSSAASINLPTDLPIINDGVAEESDEQQAKWEQRATLLAKNNPNSRPGTPEAGRIRGRSRSVSLSDKQGDENIQEAIRLHEAGDLQRSTAMFGRLADPAGANNALSQVLYGLALRHGWGCAPDATKAITYLSFAASNSAAVESLALEAGMKKGGAAKGELVLAIFELANCFRHGWGVEKDAVAAKQYYETAANLGDTDAMNEIAWCYNEGFGTKKDRYTAAQYYRLAESKGSKILGNSWIWKDKYNPR